MPHSRRVQKGSFGGKLDQLIEHFADKPAKPLRKQPDEDPDDNKSPASKGRSVHDRLFESWSRKDRRDRVRQDPHG